METENSERRSPVGYVLVQTKFPLDKNEMFNYKIDHYQSTERARQVAAERGCVPQLILGSNLYCPTSKSFWLLDEFTWDDEEDVVNYSNVNLRSTTDGFAVSSLSDKGTTVGKLCIQSFSIKEKE